MNVPFLYVTVMSAMIGSLLHDFVLYRRPVLSTIIYFLCHCCGVAFILNWYIRDSITLYMLWQLTCVLLTLLTLLVTAIRGTKRYSHTRHLILCVLWYVVAKIVESNDATIGKATDCWIAGHTIKHLLATVGMAHYVYYLMRRRDKYATRAAAAVAEGKKAQ